MTGIDLAESLDVQVHAAVRSIDDPEYPGVSIVELGLLETVDISANGRVTVGLIPTFSGCPALSMIAADVKAAVAKVVGVDAVEVHWLRAPVWTANRISGEARTALADRFTVAVQLGKSAPTCPLCGSATTEQSMFGPSRCRSVNTCSTCGETVEVMRA